MPLIQSDNTIVTLPTVDNWLKITMTIMRYCNSIIVLLLTKKLLLSLNNNNYYLLLTAVLAFIRMNVISMLVIRCFVSTINIDFFFICLNLDNSSNSQIRIKYWIYTVSPKINYHHHSKTNMKMQILFSFICELF